MSPMPDVAKGWTVEVRDDPGDPESKMWRQRYEGVRDAPSKYYAWLSSEDGSASAGSLPRGNHLYEPLLVLKRDATPWVKVTIERILRVMAKSLTVPEQVPLFGRS